MVKGIDGTNSILRDSFGLTPSFPTKMLLYLAIVGFLGYFSRKECDKILAKSGGVRKS